MDLTPNTFSRRDALKLAGCGFGYLAFAGLSTWAAEKDDPLAPKQTHFPAKAKRVIFLCMAGAPSHVDTFDYKPELAKRDGQNMPRARTFAKLLASPWKFAQHGQAGLWVSELFPEVAKHADELCLLRGMNTNVPAHAQAFLQMHTGIFQFKRPSMGAWALYGLGTDNQNLPGFVVMCPGKPVVGPQLWGNSFLPGIYQGTHIHNGRIDPKSVIANVNNGQLGRAAQREQMDLLKELNELHKVLGRLLERLPPELRDSADGRELYRLCDQGDITIAHLINRRLQYSAQSKDYEFSRTTVNELWAAGLEDVRQAVAKVDLLKPMQATLGMRVYDLTR